MSVTVVLLAPCFSVGISESPLKKTKSLLSEQVIVTRLQKPGASLKGHATAMERVKGGNLCLLVDRSSEMR